MHDGKLGMGVGTADDRRHQLPSRPRCEHQFNDALSTFREPTLVQPGRSLGNWLSLPVCRSNLSHGRGRMLRWIVWISQRNEPADYQRERRRHNPLSMGVTRSDCCPASSLGKKCGYPPTPGLPTSCPHHVSVLFLQACEFLLHFSRVPIVEVQVVLQIE